MTGRYAVYYIGYERECIAMCDHCKCSLHLFTLLAFLACVTTHLHHTSSRLHIARHKHDTCAGCIVYNLSNAKDYSGRTTAVTCTLLDVSHNKPTSQLSSINSSAALSLTSQLTMPLCVQLQPRQPRPPRPPTPVKPKRKQTLLTVDNKQLCACTLCS